MPKYDAIVVPGGGVRASGALPSWVRRRLDRALHLYDGGFLMTLSAMSPHRPPPLDAGGFPIFEAVAGAKYLMAAGIPEASILVEAQSCDTVGNAFFSRVIHSEPQGLRRLLIIASDFHLPRMEAAFRWVYGLTPRAVEYELHFESIHDPDLAPAVLESRQKRERQSLERMKPLVTRVTTLRDFHRWLFAEHAAYNASRSAFRQQAVKDSTLDSY